MCDYEMGPFLSPSWTDVSDTVDFFVKSYLKTGTFDHLLTPIYFVAVSISYSMIPI